MMTIPELINKCITWSGKVVLVALGVLMKIIIDRLVAKIHFFENSPEIHKSKMAAHDL